MKALMKLLATIIVVTVIGFIVGYLLMNGAKVQQEMNSGESISGEMVEPSVSGEEKWQIVETISGEESNEESSGENKDTVSKEMKIAKIKEMINDLVSGEVQNTSHENLTMDLVNDSAKDFMKYFKQNTLSVTVNVKSGMIEIIPDTDFVNNMVYYFDENGELILYESVSQTVEGSCKYYFDKGNGIGIEPNFEEGVTYTEEIISSIANRAKLLYDKFMVTE